MWNAAATPLASYRIYYGTASRSYSQVIDAGTQTVKRVTGLQMGQVHYFAVKTRLASGAESDFSAEVSWSLADSDNDGIADAYETGTGAYRSPTDAGTNPSKR